MPSSPAPRPRMHLTIGMRAPPLHAVLEQAVKAVIAGVDPTPASAAAASHLQWRMAAAVVAAAVAAALLG